MRDSSATLIIYGTTLLFAFLGVGLWFISLSTYAIILASIILFVFLIIIAGIIYFAHNTTSIRLRYLICGVVAFLILSTIRGFYKITTPWTYVFPEQHVSITLPDKTWKVEDKMLISRNGDALALSKMMTLPVDILDNFSHEEFISLALGLPTTEEDIPHHESQGCYVEHLECIYYISNRIKDSPDRIYFVFLKDKEKTYLLQLRMTPQYLKLYPDAASNMIASLKKG